jgi:hypothetical protein
VQGRACERWCALGYMPSKRTWPAHAKADRCVFNDLRAVHIRQRRLTTPALALFVALFSALARVPAVFGPLRATVS